MFGNVVGYQKSDAKKGKKGCICGCRTLTKVKKSYRIILNLPYIGLHEKWMETERYKQTRSLIG